MDDKVIPGVEKYSKPCSFLFLSVASIVCHAAHQNMNCSFVAWAGKPSNATRKQFPTLYCVFFFHFPLCTPELHMREIWQIEMRTLTKDQQPSAGGCEGHLFVTSDPTSCSCLHPSAPPRSQPSPRSWHWITNFMPHFRFASFPLSIVKGRVDPPESAF